MRIGIATLILLLVVQADEPAPTEREKVLEVARAWKTADLLDLKADIDRLVFERLTTPARAHIKAFEGRKDVSVIRLVRRGLIKIRSPRGGGAYYSFETRSHDYNEKPDIELQKTYFRSGFAGGDLGAVVPVEARQLQDVTLEHAPPLLKLAPGKFHAEGRKLGERAHAKKGQVYLIRSVRWNETDLTAAFQVLDTDAYGATLAWRLLRTGPVGPRPR